MAEGHDGGEHPINDDTDDGADDEEPDILEDGEERGGAPARGVGSGAGDEFHLAGEGAGGRAVANGHDDHGGKKLSGREGIIGREAFDGDAPVHFDEDAARAAITRHGDARGQNIGRLPTGLVKTGVILGDAGGDEIG